jgi:hypothetical protein
MDKCTFLKLACPTCEDMLETKYFNDSYIVGVCTKCQDSAVAYSENARQRYEVNGGDKK